MVSMWEMSAISTLGTNVSNCPAISAIICTHNRYDLLPSAIRSLAEQDIDRSALEIVVVDNSSDTQAAEAFGQRYAGVQNFRYIVETTPGLSNARNVGARVASGQIIAYIDDDAIAAPQWAREIVAAYDVFGGAAAIVGGPVRPIWLTQRPTWLTKDLEGFFSIVDRGTHLRELGADEWLAGCNLSFDRETLLSSGGFDRGLGRVGAISLLSNEELHMVDTIRSRGGKIIYAPHAIVDHKIDPSRVNPEWLKRRIAWQAVSDALSHPQSSLQRATIVSDRYKALSRFKRAFYFANLLNRKQRVDAADLDRIYNTVLLLLCRGN